MDEEQNQVLDGEEQNFWNEVRGAQEDYESGMGED